MKIKIPYIPVFIVLLLIINTSCDNDDNAPACSDQSNPECPNYDPCFGQAADARFSIAQQYSNSTPWDTVFIEDSISSGGLMRFSALDLEADYYTWYLGTETIAGPEVYVVEREVFNLTDGRYSAILVTEKDVDSTCTATHAAKDSVFRYFYKPDRNELLHASWYRGVYKENPSDTVEFELFYYDTIRGSFVGDRLFSCNLANSQDTLTADDISAGVNSRIFFNGDDIQTPKGELFINSNDSVIMFDFRMFEKDWSFSGKIIPK